METFGAILWIWFCHAAFAVVMSAPVVFFGRKRVRWYAWELLVLVLPFLVWTILIFSDLALGKSLANLGEPIYFSFAIPVAGFVRVLLGTRIPQKASAVGFIAVMCIVAAGVFFAVPPLPE